MFGEKLDSWETVVDWRKLARLQPIVGNADPPLHRLVVGQRSIF